jgi:catechol O-methyltransferase
MSSMFGSDDEEDEEVRLDSNGVMAFHKGTEDAMFIYLENHGGATSTSECLDIIDTFANKRHWMMHMGPEKREILQDAVTLIPNWTKKDQPLLILELGSYCGYSTSFLASLLADRDGSTSTRSMIVSVEPEAEAVRWTQRLVGLCGLKDISVVLQTVVSTLDSSDVHDDFVQKVNGLDFGEKGQKPLFDMVFIDHDKTKYLTDLRLLLQQGLLKPGCVVVADNVHSFDQPLTEYLDFVRSDSRFLRSDLRPARVEYSSVQQVPASKSGSYFFDAVEISALCG